jgi:hypothetical protein
VGTFAFSSESSIVHAWPAPGANPDVVVKQFETVLQPVILQALGWQTLHAAAVAGSGGALALCGVRGSGKSTIAFALRQAGWTQIADDALVLSVDAGHVTAHPLPFTSRLREASFRHFAGPSDVLADAHAHGDRPATPLRAIFVLQQIANLSDPSVSPVAPARAFSGLLVHAHCFDMQDREEAQRLTLDYLAIAERVPVLALTYGPDLSGLARVVAVIDEAAASLGVERWTHALSL